MAQWPPPPLNTPLDSAYVCASLTCYCMYVFVLCNAYGFQVLAAMCCVALHRRHLMVWKIFAPRFVYSGASFFVTAAASVLVYLFVLRVNRSVTNWVRALCSDAT
jgi:hypothetical protein